MSMALLADLFHLVQNFRYRKSWSDAVDKRVSEMASAGFSWSELPRSELCGTNQDFLAMKGPNVKVYGALELDVHGSEVRIYDVVCNIATTNNFFKNSFHSVITVLPSKRFELPHFYYYPNDPGNKQTVTAYEEVPSDIALTNNYVLESPDGRRAESLFDSKFAYETFCPAIERNGWSVEWTEPRLVMYGWNRVMPADRVNDYVGAAMELVQMLEPASAAYQAGRAADVNELAGRTF